jgi:hypothetical protein
MTGRTREKNVSERLTLEATKVMIYLALIGWQMWCFQFVLHDNASPHANDVVFEFAYTMTATGVLSALVIAGLYLVLVALRKSDERN